MFEVNTHTWRSLSHLPGKPSARAEAMMWIVPEELSLIVSGGRGPFRRGLDLTRRDTFRLHLLNGWTEISQTGAVAELANRSTEVATVRNHSENFTTTVYAFSGSSSTLPAFVNRPDGLQKNLVRYKNGWKEVEAASPVPRARTHHPIAHSKKLNALFIYGGYTNDAVNGAGLFTPENYLGGLWKFDINSGAWTQFVFDENNGPGHRDNAKLIVDDRQDRIWQARQQPQPMEK